MTNCCHQGVTFSIRKYWKTSKIPVFGGAYVYLVIFGFVIMAFRSNLEKFDLYKSILNKFGKICIWCFCQIGIWSNSGDLICLKIDKNSTFKFTLNISGLFILQKFIFASSKATNNRILPNICKINCSCFFSPIICIWTF